MGEELRVLGDFTAALQLVLEKSLIVKLLLLEDKSLDLPDGDVVDSLDSADLFSRLDLLLQLGVEPLHLVLVGAADLRPDQVEYLLLQLVRLAQLVLLEGERFFRLRLLLLASLLIVEAAAGTPSTTSSSLLSISLLVALLRSPFLSIVGGR